MKHFDFNLEVKDVSVRISKKADILQSRIIKGSRILVNALLLERHPNTGLLCVKFIR
jgi:hypothetical protein